MRNQSLLEYFTNNYEYLADNESFMFSFYNSIPDYLTKSKAYLGFKLSQLYNTPPEKLTNPKKFKKTIKQFVCLLNAQLEYVEEECSCSDIDSMANIIEMCSVALDVTEKIDIYSKQPPKADCYHSLEQIYEALAKGFIDIHYFNNSFIDLPMFASLLTKEKIDVSIFAKLMAQEKFDTDISPKATSLDVKLAF